MILYLNLTLPKLFNNSLSFSNTSGVCDFSGFSDKPAEITSETPLSPQLVSFNLATPPRKNSSPKPIDKFNEHSNQLYLMEIHPIFVNDANGWRRHYIHAVIRTFSKLPKINIFCFLLRFYDKK